jgi:hypothetical protein
VFILKADRVVIIKIYDQKIHLLLIYFYNSIRKGKERKGKERKGRVYESIYYIWIVTLLLIVLVPGRLFKLLITNRKKPIKQVFIRLKKQYEQNFMEETTQ